MRRINFNKDVHMHKACGRNNLRLSMQYIFFHNGYAVASDGGILVKNRLSEMSTLDEAQIDMLEGKFLHWKNYREILGWKEIRVSEDGIECRSKDISRSAIFRFGADDLVYPDYEKTIAEAEACPDEIVTCIGLDIDRIVRIQNAMINPIACMFRFKGKERAVIVSSRESDSTGLIMPVRMK